MPVTKIISGGQSGADQGGLEAAAALGIETGGMMPRGFLTEYGPAPEVASAYGLCETSSPEYPPRTRLNIANSDGTLIFGDCLSPGTQLTSKHCFAVGKPCLVVSWSPNWSMPTDEFLRWLRINSIAILNVAGNRESKNPGIQKACREFLISALAGEKTDG
jgi:hypothetical protein